MYFSIMYVKSYDISQNEHTSVEYSQNNGRHNSHRINYFWWCQGETRVNSKLEQFCCFNDYFSGLFFSMGLITF